jgi:hypothetical protein
MMTFHTTLRVVARCDDASPAAGTSRGPLGQLWPVEAGRTILT